MMRASFDHRCFDLNNEEGKDEVKHMRMFLDAVAAGPTKHRTFRLKNGLGQSWVLALLFLFLLFPASVENVVHDRALFFYLYLAAANMVSVGFCIAAGRRWKPERLRWQILALAQMLHVLLYLAASASNAHLLPYSFCAWFGNFASAASAILILPALMSTRMERGVPLAAVDTLLAVAFGAVLALSLGSGPLAGDGSKRLWTNILILALLSVLALVTRFSPANLESSRFFNVISKTIWVDLLTSLVVNGVCVHWFPDVPNAFLGPLAALPPLLLCYWTVQVAAPPARSRIALDRIVIDSLQPSVLTLSTVVLTLFAFGRRPLLIGVLIVFVVLLYVVRTQLFYSRLFRERQTLRTQTKHLHELATRDPLTGIANRRWFEETLARKLEEPFEYPCSLLMVDTDQFKEINDSQGHRAGDAVLCMIADVLQRECDGTEHACVARIGGDEFAVLLPSTSREHAVLYAERIRSGVEQLGVARCHGATVSIGVSTFHTYSLRAELLQAADEALYRAKACGRNAVHA